MRGAKGPVAALGITFACGACTSLLGDFGSTSGSVGDAGAGPMDSTVAPADGGSTLDSTLEKPDVAPVDDASPADDGSDEASAPSFGADASCEGGPCVIAVAANDDHTCALMADQTLKCWGNNEYGQTLWNSPLGDVTTPTTVTGLGAGGAGAVKSVRLGDRFSCALLMDQSVWCWGDNSFGQIGVPEAGPPAPSRYPVAPTQVFPPGSVNIVYAGAYHACVMLNTPDGGVGQVLCWGENNFGEVGVPDAAVVPAPAPLDIPNIERMTLSAFVTCAVRSTVPFGECIGYNDFGQLGRGPSPDGGAGTDTLAHPVPAGVEIGNLGQYGSFPHGTGYHEGVVFTNGTVAMWGDNSAGQLGPQVDAAVNPTPTLVTTIADVSGLALLQYSSCALRTDGTVYCWGSTASGQNGNTTTVGSIQAMPSPVTGISTATGLTSGLNHACALLANGTMACWGDNLSGELGWSDAGYSATPGLVRF